MGKDLPDERALNLSMGKDLLDERALNLSKGKDLLDERALSLSKGDSTKDHDAPASAELETYLESEFGPYPPTALERADHDPGVRRQVQELMVTIVDESGPICLERLSRRVIRAYGRTRLVDSRLAQLRALVPVGLRRDREEGFLWPAGRDPRSWTGFRTSDDLKARPLSDIALLEIANAMGYVAAQAMGIGEDELFKQTYRLFGGNRLTEPVRERLSAALHVGVEAGRLIIRGGVVTVGMR
jgi:hypothetical protein